MQSEVGGT